MYIHFDVWISCLSTDLNLSKPSFKVQHFALCLITVGYSNGRNPVWRSQNKWQLLLRAFPVVATWNEIGLCFTTSVF